MECAAAQRLFVVSCNLRSMDMDMSTWHEMGLYNTTISWKIKTHHDKDRTIELINIYLDIFYVYFKFPK